MRTVKRASEGTSALVAALDRALGRLLRPLANLLPRRIRRLAEQIERKKTRPRGQVAAVGFLLAAIVYGLVAGGQVGRVGDSLLALSGFGIENVEIAGNQETSELAILEKLEIGGSLIVFDVADAQERVLELPWVANATVRKFYPGTLSVEIEERAPYALWQRQGEVFVIDRTGTAIGMLEESRHAGLPFVVGDRANLFAESFLNIVAEQPEIAERMLAAVYVAGRRWDVHLENGVVVKLPEHDVAEALASLVRLNDTRGLLARDVVVVDLRLADRITVRLPEGRSLDEVIDEAAGAEQART